MWICHREIRRRSELPRFRDQLRASRPWEVGLFIGTLAGLPPALFFPWAVTGSPRWGLFGLAALCVLWAILVVAVVVIVAVRHPMGPTRTDSSRRRLVTTVCPSFGRRQKG